MKTIKMMCYFLIILRGRVVLIIFLILY